jgi:uncharacterized protein YgbK (DUF1537 family)
VTLSLSAPRILADDLTGALDASAPFAAPGAPVRLPWTAPLGDGAIAISSESRDLPEGEAVARTLAAAARLPGGGLWLKKVDSVLRGHPVAEAAAVFDAGGFRACVVAPAFPEMGRVTRGGRQWMLDTSGFYPVGPRDLAAAFAARGVAVAVIDAETPADLATAVRAHAGERVLWVGSRGLASALAGPRALLPVPAISGLVIGTAHPATRAQVARLGSIASGPERASETRRTFLLDPVPTAPDAAATRIAIRDALAGLEPDPDPGALLVVGGDTLAEVLAALAPRALAIEGEVAPGLPLSRLEGGRHHGLVLVTKSGGFGGPDLLFDLLASRLSQPLG